MAHKFNEARLFINYTKMNKLRSIIQRCNNGRIVWAVKSLLQKEEHKIKLPYSVFRGTMAYNWGNVILKFPNKYPYALYLMDTSFERYTMIQKWTFNLIFCSIVFFLCICQIITVALTQKIRGKIRYRIFEKRFAFSKDFQKVVTFASKFIS